MRSPAPPFDNPPHFIYITPMIDEQTLQAIVQRLVAATRLRDVVVTLA
ncbi:MAG: hypothetical protein IAE79_22295 [Anaerolinea sp.]|nr:hypothetical protein [Anaerolinea sp.]